MMEYRFRLVYRIRQWKARREAIPLMAQALYEPLTPEEEAKKDSLFLAFPELAEEFESLSRFSRALRLSEDSWSGDLLPALREQLALSEAPAPAKHHLRAYALAFSVLLVLSGGLYGIFMLSGDMPSGGPHAGVQTTTPDTQLSRASREACDLVALGETEEAAEMLEAALRGNPRDAYRAEALLTLADIEYSYLQRYDRAYEVFKFLEREHPDVFTRNWNHDRRVRLLVAAFPDAFEPLRALEAAARSEDPMPGYEALLAQYPDSIWAEEAMQSMSRLVVRNFDVDPVNTIQVLQRVRNACADPVARERIDLEIGNYYCDSLDDLDLARKHYFQAAASRHVAVATRAQEALARLE